MPFENRGHTKDLTWIRFAVNAGVVQDSLVQDTEIMEEMANFFATSTVVAG